MERETQDQYQARVARMREEQEKAEERRKREEAIRRDNQQREREQGLCIVNDRHCSELTILRAETGGRTTEVQSCPETGTGDCVQEIG